VLVPSLDLERCVRETIRRQLTRPFARPPSNEDAVIRRRFDLYVNLPARKIETMRSPFFIVDEIVAAIQSARSGMVPTGQR
jgi:shikimate kinase